MKIDTLCVQGGYQPKCGEPRQVPIYQTTTFKYDTPQHMGSSAKPSSKRRNPPISSHRK